MTPSTACPHPDESLVNIEPVRDMGALVAFIGDCPLCHTRGVYRSLSKPPVRTGVVAEGVQDSGDDSAHGLHVVSHTAKGEANGVPESTNNGPEGSPKGG